MQKQAFEALRGAELLVGLALLGLGALYAWGAMDIAADAGYAGIGPNFLPWLVSAVLVLCGLGLLVQAWRGGFVNRDLPEGASSGDWRAFTWVCAGLLANALLIERIGFVLSCTLCFVLAVRGFHAAQGRTAPRLQSWIRDICIGLAISAPVLWIFGMVLGIELPALSETGWI